MRLRFIPAGSGALLATVATRFMGLGDRIGKNVEPRMLTAGHKHKVLKAVIKTVMVHMVNNLMRFKDATVGFLPDKAMLKDIALGVRCGVLRRVDVPVLPMLIATTVPLRMKGTFLASKVMTLNIRLTCLGAHISRLSARLAQGDFATASAGAQRAWCNATLRPYLAPVSAGASIMTLDKLRGLAFDISAGLVIISRERGRLAATTLAKHGHTPIRLCLNYTN